MGSALAFALLADGHQVTVWNRTLSKADPLVKYVGLPKKFVAGEVVFKDKADECASGVHVKLSGGGVHRETTTDIFGDFEFEGLAKNETYQLSVLADGYATKQIELTTLKDVNLGEIVLEPN